ncbi:MAG: hypothetical protein GX538_04560 [Gammaproteobacteria bacterium]|nr:hypothetical protein [Gammaproteobacteria bacterium]
MNSLIRRSLLWGACALGIAAASAHAQPAAASCPQLPADSGLSWEQRGNDAFLICSAVDANGNEVFGLSLSADTAFQPRRGNREERGVVAGQDIRWYRAEVANQPELLVRETLVELDRDRVAHIWVRRQSEAELRDGLVLVERLDFDAPRLSSN